MDRSQILSILNTMSDNNLVQALSSVGVETHGDEDEGLDFGTERAPGLESWNDREVTVPESKRPPIVDKSKFTVKDIAKEVPQYALMGHDSDLEDLAYQQDHDGSAMR